MSIVDPAKIWKMPTPTIIGPIASGKTWMQLQDVAFRFVDSLPEEKREEAIAVFDAIGKALSPADSPPEDETQTNKEPTMEENNTTQPVSSGVEAAPIRPKKFIRVNIVEATPMTLGEYNSFRGWTIPPNEDPATPGYKVVYDDGYVSWCPKARFDEVSRPVDGMTFGQALEALKMGKKVARRGWNGKGMYLWLLPATKVKREWCHDPRLVEAMGPNDSLLCLGSIRMFTHDSTGRNAVLTGWLASQSDMLLEDWMVVEDDAATPADISA